MNGLISFNRPISSYDTRGWPETAYNLPASFVAVFYADTNGYFVGQIKHKQIVNGNELNMAAEYIARKRNLTRLNANYMYLAEWKDMTPCNCYFPVSKSTTIFMQSIWAKWKNLSLRFLYLFILISLWVMRFSKTDAQRILEIWKEKFLSQSFSSKNGTSTKFSSK